MSHNERRYKIPGLAWLFFLIGLLAYELWAIFHSHQPTLSAWVWRQDATYPWFKWVVLTGVSYLMYHFFWQRR